MCNTSVNLNSSINMVRLNHLIDPKIKYVQVSSFSDDLLKAYSSTEGRASALINLNHYTSCFEGYVRTIVSEVKKSLTQPQPLLQIDLKSLQLNHFPRLHFECVIRNLYQQYGIIVKTADSPLNPNMIEVACGLDNRQINPLLSNNLIASRKEGKFCDFTIKNSDEAGTVFPCHQVILAAGSPFFERYFSGDFAESESTQEYTLPPSLTDGQPFTTRQVETLLDYIYSGNIKLDELSIVELFQFLELASYFDLTSLHEECIELLGSKIDRDNVQDIYHLAVRLNTQDLIHYSNLQMGAEGLCLLVKAAVEQENTEVISACVPEMKKRFLSGRNLGSFSPPHHTCLYHEYGPLLGFRGVFEVLKSSLQDENPEFANACVSYFNSYIRFEYETILSIAEELKELGRGELLEACQKFRETHNEGAEKPGETNKDRNEKI